MKRCYPFFILIFLSAFLSCTGNHSRIQTSFYYWKQANEFSDSTQKLIDSFKVRKFYIHVMDVIWNERAQRAMPVAKSALDKNNPVCKGTIIPVVFLNNTVALKIDSNDCTLLAKNIVDAAKVFIRHVSGDSVLKELQIDCDWTGKSKDTYFYLLRLIKIYAPTLRLSATIRLYPYKYFRQTGVPPVDYGVLMCYNLDKASNTETENSILNSDVLRQYLGFGKYPLPLKPALPVFGWYIWTRGGQFQNILYLPPGFIHQKALQWLSGNNYRLLQDTVINGYYLRSGDVLRNEYPAEKELEKSLALIKHELPGCDEIIFYHWDEKYLPCYEETILQAGAAN